MLIRSHTCGEVRESNVGQRVRLNGWVNSYRDHGDLIFIDLRDRYGLTQLVFDKEEMTKTPAIMEAADKLRNEDVIAVEGTVRVRIGGENPKLATGKVEVVVGTRAAVAGFDHGLFHGQQLFAEAAHAAGLYE